MGGDRAEGILHGADDGKNVIPCVVGVIDHYFTGSREKHYNVPLNIGDVMASRTVVDHCVWIPTTSLYPLQ